MCVLDATVLCATVLRLTLSCSKLVTFLFALSKEDNRCLSEKKSQQCVLKSLCHPPAVPFGTVQLQKCQMEVLCFVIFLFFPTQQYSVGFSDMEYFFCCHGSSLLPYLLCNSFSRKPLVEEECSPGLLPAMSLCGRGEGVPALVCLCSLPGCLSPFSCSPLGL